MARIRSENTGPELALRRALYAAGVRGWRCNVKALPGKPDVAFTRARVAVFCDGRYWHGHPDYFTFGKSGPYWDEKMRRTQQRDREANDELRRRGWEVIRIWDFEIEQDLAACVERVRQAVARRRAAGRAIRP